MSMTNFLVEFECMWMLILFSRSCDKTQQREQPNSLYILNETSTLIQLPLRTKSIEKQNTYHTRSTFFLFLFEFLDYFLFRLLVSLFNLHVYVCSLRQPKKSSIIIVLCRGFIFIHLKYIVNMPQQMFSQVFTVHTSREKKNKMHNSVFKKASELLSCRVCRVESTTENDFTFTIKFTFDCFFLRLTASSLSFCYICLKCNKRRAHIAHKSEAKIVLCVYMPISILYTKQLFKS